MRDSTRSRNPQKTEKLNVENEQGIEILGTCLDTDKEVKEPIAKARIAIIEHQQRISSRNVSLKNRLKIYEIYAKPILLCNVRRYPLKRLIWRN